MCGDDDDDDADAGDEYHTPSVCELPPDGFRWRKYGRKAVGSTGAAEEARALRWRALKQRAVRHYYRCVEAGCPARRHASQSDVGGGSAGAAVLVTVVTVGQHNHAAPAASACKSGASGWRAGCATPPRALTAVAERADAPPERAAKRCARDEPAADADGAQRTR